MKKGQGDSHYVPGILGLLVAITKTITGIGTTNLSEITEKVDVIKIILSRNFIDPQN